MAREAIPKKIRFEVFKRDRFTCQYCGAKAPDVILHIDHIHPVAAGGDNDILNLITACAPCNSGKGARTLADNTVLEKQRAQLEELSERREQLEMLLAWRQGLGSLRETEIDAVDDLVAAFCRQHGLSESGRRTAHGWIEAFGLAETLEALEVSLRQYAVSSETNPTGYTADSIAMAFQKVPGIARVRRSNKPYLRDLFYIRGILKRRMRWINEREVIPLLERAHLAGVSIEELKSIARTSDRWDYFAADVLECIEACGGDDA